MSSQKKSYAAVRQQLDQVMERLQDDEIDIDEATKLYEQGMGLVAELEQYLQTAEIKVRKIKTAHS
jgi:exodeoxyribonuclease VII small subunit